MARDTRDGVTLREVFDALGGDAALIAETLARQTVADRLVRELYASDGRFHGDTRRKAAEALARCDSTARLRTLGPGYRETTWRLGSRPGDFADAASDDRAIVVDAIEWQERLARLRQEFGRASGRLPIRTVSALEETPDAFVASSVLAQGENEITVATQVWPKVPFDAWWASQRARYDAPLPAASGTCGLPAIASSGCAPDTWTPSVVPAARNYHSAVWTGAEMIVWGGAYNGYPVLSTGARYDPATDTWSRTSTGDGVPLGRGYHTAVWTGTEMIVWGGQLHDWNAGGKVYPAGGGRYNPTTDSWTPTSEGLHLPVGRMGHSAFWTGTEMIVWGGYVPDLVHGGEIQMNDGARYDPATDAWIPMAAFPVSPRPRAWASTVWTGTEMIVWGGQSATSPYPYLNSGGRYDPASDTWTPTPIPASVPAGRAGASAVWTGTEMIVWGGHADNGMLNTGGRYNPATDSWTPTSVAANVPMKRELHTALWTGSAMIVWGGYSGTYPYLSSGGRYDPATDSWTATSSGADVPSGRKAHTAVWTGKEMIVWGGTVGGSVNPDLNTGGRYDPLMDTWAPTSTGGIVPAARKWHTAVWTGAEMIVWGGDDGTTYLNSGGRYDPVTDTWTPTSTAAGVPVGRSGHAAVWTGTEMVVWGGHHGSTNDRVYPAQGGRYNPGTDAWTATSVVGAPEPRGYATAVWTGHEMIVWGGSYVLGGSVHYLNTGGRYDPATDSWVATSTAGSLPEGRSGHASVWTGKEMIVWGGGYAVFVVFPPVTVRLASGGRYDPSTDTWTATSTGSGVPEARGGASGVWTGREMIVWGGTDEDVYGLDTGGRYDPSTDTWTPTSTGMNLPAGRVYHTAVWTGAEMIVWGGSGSSIGYNSGGRYDPALDAWTATSTGTGVPSGRELHTAVWSGTEMIVWGGEINYSTHFNSVGSYCVAACAVPGAWFQDVDGDGYGNPTVSVFACSRPRGHVDNGLDCDDEDSSTHPGAPEIKDGTNNQCPAACDGDEAECRAGAVDEVTGPLLWNESMLGWAPQEGAAGYEVVRSKSASFVESCVAFGTTLSPWIEDDAIPDAGSVWFYLVRSVAPVPPGSWGLRSSGIERSGICLAP